MAIIRDGAGGSNGAHVDTENRLRTLAVTVSEENHAAADHGEAFFMNTADTANTLTLATGNTYKMLYIESNYSGKNLIVEKVLFTASAPGLVMRWVRNPVLGTISEHNVHVPSNLNFGSTETAQGLFYTWDETGTTGLGGLTNGTCVTTFIEGSGFIPHPIDGAMVLGNNNSFSIEVTNTTGSSIECAINIRFYYGTPTLNS